MDLITLTEKEFTDFTSNHEQATFLNTVNWGKLKETNGWKYELLGFKDNDKVIAAMLLLSKNTPIKKKMFYAPRGFILDYHNKELVKEFTLKAKKYVKEHNGIFLKIDPYVMHKQRDIDGKVVEGGIDNSDIKKYIESLGFKEQCSKPGQQSLQAKWLYWIPLKNKTVDDILMGMNREKRRIIKNNKTNGIVVREGTYDELDEFKKIMDHTSERREFINRSLAYYQNMYKAFGDGKYLKLYFTELMIEEKLNEFKNELPGMQKDYYDLEEGHKNGTRTITEKKLEEKHQELIKFEQKIEKYEQLFKEHGPKLTLGGLLCFTYGKEVLAFAGGSYDKYMEFQSSYSMYFEMIEYAINNGYDYYNFYGISSDLTEKDPMYGVYLFKKGFGGEVVELLGEYDLKVSGFYYFIYKTSYFIVHKLKKLKTKLHRKK